MRRLRQWLNAVWTPGAIQETAIALRRRMYYSRRRMIAIFQSFRTAPGRKRLKHGLLRRLPYIVLPLSRIYRRTLIKNVRLVAVVGTFGKTTTTRAVLAALGFNPSIHHGWNTGTALSDRILCIRPKQRHAVLEVAISDKGQMGEIAHMLRPDIVVVTCIGSEHMTSLGSLEVTRYEKSRMVAAVPRSGFVILNGDDPNVLWMKSVAHAPVVTYGFGEGNTIQAYDVDESDLSGIQFTLRIGQETRRIHTHLVGRHMVYPVLAAIAVAHSEGFDIQHSIAALAVLKPTHNRLEPIPLPNGAWVLLDAHKAALETIESALDALSHLPANRKIVVVADVEEPPGSQGPIYKALGKRIGAVSDRVIFVGGKTNYDRLKVGLRDGGLTLDAIANHRTDPHAIGTTLNEMKLGHGDLILIKGRSNQHLERVALLLSGTPVMCSARICLRRHDCVSCPLLRRED